jgi:hypothetical protein
MLDMKKYGNLRGLIAEKMSKAFNVKEVTK